MAQLCRQTVHHILRYHVRKVHIFRLGVQCTSRKLSGAQRTSQVHLAQGAKRKSLAATFLLKTSKAGAAPPPRDADLTLRGYPVDSTRRGNELVHFGLEVDEAADRLNTLGNCNIVFLDSGLHATTASRWADLGTDPDQPHQHAVPYGAHGDRIDDHMVDHMSSVAILAQGLFQLIAHS